MSLGTKFIINVEDNGNSNSAGILIIVDNITIALN